VSHHDPVAGLEEGAGALSTGLGKLYDLVTARARHDTGRSRPTCGCVWILGSRAGSPGDSLEDRFGALGCRPDRFGDIDRRPVRPEHDESDNGRHGERCDEKGEEDPNLAAGRRPQNDLAVNVSHRGILAA